MLLSFELPPNAKAEAESRKVFHIRIHPRAQQTSFIGISGAFEGICPFYNLDNTAICSRPFLGKEKLKMSGPTDAYSSYDVIPACPMSYDQNDFMSPDELPLPHSQGYNPTESTDQGTHG